MIGVNFLQTDASASCPDIWVSFKDDKRSAQEEEDLIRVSTAVEVESLHSRPSPSKTLLFTAVLQKEDQLLWTTHLSIDNLLECLFKCS